MRPKLFSPRNFALFLLAAGIFGGLAYWGSLGFPLPGGGVPSTAGKLVFVSDREGRKDLYLIDGVTGQGEERLTNDAAQEGEPAWTDDGQMLAFTADRNDIRQICLMYAGAGQRVVTLTNTSSTKESPLPGKNKRLYFLDSGKVSAMNQDASDPVALFPTAEERKEKLALLFENGGIAHLAVSPDGQRVATVINQEFGQVLVLYFPDEKGGAFVGAARKIYCQFLADNSLTVLFVGGGPAGEKPELIFDAGKMGQAGFRVPPLPSAPESVKDVNFLVKYDPEFNATRIPIPVPFTGFQAAADNGQVAFWYDSEDKGGLWVVDLMKGDMAVHRLASGPVTRASWSPDSKRLAYAAGGDIWSVEPGASASPVNLTGGKGKNADPVWSPARSASK